ncbi:MAG: hypothetical protein CMJ48_02910 [Planctomycetaceae bacterium]|nr:hypothetical protein [Planctomycetaceae bacterium]
MLSKYLLTSAGVAFERVFVPGRVSVVFFPPTGLRIAEESPRTAPAGLRVGAVLTVAGVLVDGVFEAVLDFVGVRAEGLPASRFSPCTRLRSVSKLRLGEIEGVARLVVGGV